MNLNYRLILASKSPRRQDLLRSLDLGFEVRTKEVDESFSPNMPVREVAAYLAQKKSAAFQLAAQELLITSDTTVVLGDDIMNKPADHKEASHMLTKLSGQVHEVVTGVCLRSLDQEIVFSEITKVYFKALTPGQITYYINTYKPYDKAGAYGIQEWIGMVGIDRIEGDYYNVMGLPTQRLYQALKEFFA